MAQLNNTIVNGILRANTVALNILKDSTGSAGGTNYILASNGTNAIWKSGSDITAMLDIVTTSKKGLAPQAAVNGILSTNNSGAVAWNKFTVMNGGAANTPDADWGKVS